MSSRSDRMALRGSKWRRDSRADARVGRHRVFFSQAARPDGNSLGHDHPAAYRGRRGARFGNRAIRGACRRRLRMPLPPVLYQDDLLVAFDKPSGLAVAPDRWAKGRPTMMAEVQSLLGRQVANVHHLDSDASGVVLCAKTKPALDFLTGQFQGKTAEKKYLALAAVVPSGRPDDAVALQRGARTEDCWPSSRSISRSAPTHAPSRQNQDRRENATADPA